MRDYGSKGRIDPGKMSRGFTQTAWDIIVALLVFVVLVPIAVAVAMPLLPFALLGGAIYGGVRIYQNYSQRSW